MREVTDGNEEAACERAQHQYERDDLCDVLGWKHVSDEQSEGGEQQRSDPHADPGDGPQIRRDRIGGAITDHVPWPTDHDVTNPAIGSLSRLHLLERELQAG